MPEKLLCDQNCICYCDRMIIKNRDSPYPFNLYSPVRGTDMNHMIQIIMHT